MTAAGEQAPTRAARPGGALTPIAVMVVVVLCLVWGVNISVIKLSNRGIPPLLAVTLRNIGAAVPVAAYLLWKGIPLVHRDRRALFGLAIGVLFGLDFLFFYGGTAYTNASRAVVIVYAQPLWVGLGAHLLLPGERLTVRRLIGLAVAIGGLGAVFLAPSGISGGSWVGDLMEVGAAIAWASSTLLIKVSIQHFDVPPSSTLFYQLVFSLPLLAAASLVLERGQEVTFSTGPVLALLFQTYVVAAGSYAIWYWMIQRYDVTALTAFTMLTPLFGVAAGGLILGEPLPPSLIAGLGMVTVGIYLLQSVPARVLARRTTGGP